MSVGRTALGAFFVLLALTNDAGCSSGSDQATLEILISDHRDAIGDFASFEVAITSIDLHRAGEPVETGWLQLQPLRAVVDLTEVIGEDSVLVVRQDIPAGTYDAIQVNANQVRGVLLDGEVIDLGSFSEAGRQPLNLANGQTGTLLVDLKVQSRHDHAGEGYVLVLGGTTQIPGR